MNRKTILGIGMVFLLIMLAPNHSLRAQSSKSQLTNLVAQLQNSPDDKELRKQIIKLVAKMSPKPELPDGLDELTGKAEYIVKNATKPADYLPAVEAYNQASLLAPWDADIYYDLGVVEEKAEKPSDSINSFNLYLFAKPNAADKRKVKKRIGALVYVAKINNFEGAIFVSTSTDRNGTQKYLITINGDEVMEEAGWIAASDEQIQNGVVLNSFHKMWLEPGHLTNRMIKCYPFTTVNNNRQVDYNNVRYMTISPDGQSMSDCDSNGNLIGKREDDYKRVSSP